MRSDFQMIEAEGMVIGTKTRLREGKIKIWDVREIFFKKENKEK